MAITSNKALLPQVQAQGICQDITPSQCEECFYSFYACAEELLDTDLSLSCLKYICTVIVRIKLLMVFLN